MADSRENKMGTMPVNKLLVSMAVPMIISMLVQALYNVVDSIFVARLSQDALTAVSLAFSMQNLMIAVGAGTGVGVNALLSKSLGEKNFGVVNKSANNSLFLVFCTYILFFIIGVSLTGIYFDIQTDVQTIAQYGKDYLYIILLGSFGIFGQMCFERLLTATGRTIYSMIIQMSGAIINIILDPIMIFGYFGFPALGVKGAALATVVGQVCACIIGFVFNIKYNSEIKLNLKDIKPDPYVIKRIYAVGVPSIVMASIGSVMTFGLNKILIGFTTTAVAVFGVYFKLQSFIFMPVFGLNNGLVPIVAYNYGARNRERIVKVIKLAMAYAFGIMAVGFIVFESIPELLLNLFRSNDPAENAAMLEIGVPALRIIACNFIVAGFCIIMGSTFQALGNAVYSLIVSVARQLVVLLPAAYILSLFGNLNIVWFCFPIAETISLIVSLFFFKKNMKLINFGSEDNGKTAITGPSATTATEPTEKVSEPEDTCESGDASESDDTQDNAEATEVKEEPIPSGA